MNNTRNIIALVGRAVSGKDTIGLYLVANYGFNHVSTGQLVRDYISEHDLGEPSRDLMIKTANEVRNESGVDYFVQRALEIDTDRLAIDGLRAVGEIVAAREAGSKIVAVDAPIENRFAWAEARGRTSDQITFADFERQEKLESVNKSASAQSIDEVVASADYVIANHDDFDTLYRHVDTLMAELGIGKTVKHEA